MDILLRSDRFKSVFVFQMADPFVADELFSVRSNALDLSLPKHPTNRLKMSILSFQLELPSLSSKAHNNVNPTPLQAKAKTGEFVFFLPNFQLVRS